MELTGDTRGHYSSGVFEKTLNKKIPGSGNLMWGLYADWFTSERRKIIKQVAASICDQFHEIAPCSRDTHLMSLEKIRKSFDTFLENYIYVKGVDCGYKGWVKSAMKFVLAKEWSKLLDDAEKSIQARGIERNIKKIPSKVLDPLKEHIENVFRKYDYNSVKKLNEYILNFKTALVNHEKSNVSNEVYEFFNDVSGRNVADFSKHYANPSSLGDGVTNTTYLLYKYATGFSDVANTIYKQLVEKSERMVFNEIKTILGDKNSKFIDYMLKFANERISVNPEIKDKKELDLEDYKKSAYRLPFVNAFINLYGIIKEHKGSLSTREKSDINKFLNVKYKNYVCLEEPITNFNRSIDKETRRIIMSFINIFCDNQ